MASIPGSTARDAPRALTVRAHAREMAVGLALGLAATAISAALTESQSQLYLAVLLSGVGFAYLGFAVADGRPSALAVQAVSITVFLAIAYLGFQLHSNALLGAGFLAHGAWDFVHHDGHGPTHVRDWYPPFCAVVDVVIAVPLLAGSV